MNGKYLLDTNIIIALLASDANVKPNLAQPDYSKNDSIISN